MPSEHYFSAEPAGDFKSRQITVQLNGESVNLKTAGGVFSPEHIDLGTQILLQHIDRAPREGDILDLGCGTGLMTAELAARGADVTAVDISPALVDIARNRLPAEHAHKVTFASGDMTADYGRFDFVLAMDSLIYYGAEDIGRTLRSLGSRAGQVVFTVAPGLSWIMKAHEHQTHHRGQCTIYIRLQGVRPPAEKLF